MERQEIYDKWTSKEGHTYNYLIVTIDSKIVRIFNSYRHTITNNSEVFTHFVEKYTA